MTPCRSPRCGLGAHSPDKRWCHIHHLHYVVCGYRFRPEVVEHQLPAQPLAAFITERAAKHDSGLLGVASDIALRGDRTPHLWHCALQRILREKRVHAKTADTILTALHTDVYQVFGYEWTGSLEVAE